MTEITTLAPAPAVTAAPAPKAKPAAKKAPAKKAAPAKAAKAAEKSGPAGGLTKPQVRILAALAKAARPMSRAQIAEKAQVAETWVTGFTVRACKANRTPALVEQKLAREVGVEVDGRKERLVEVTAAGRKALARVKV